MIAKFLDDNKPKTWTVSNFIDLIQFHLICQMLAKFFGVEFERTVSKFWKRKKKNCVVSTYFIKRGSWYTCCFSYLNLLFFVCLFFSVGVWETEWLLLRSCSFWNCGLGVTVPPVVTSKPQFQNTFSATATLFPICYLSQLKHLDMKAIVLGKHVRRTSFIKPKRSTLCRRMNKRDEQ